MKSNLFGIPFWTASKGETLNAILAIPESGRAQSVAFANAHVVVEAHWNSKFKELLNRCNIISVDGVPIKWVAKIKGISQCQRYSGPDLMVDVFAKTPGKKHFFLGSTQSTLDLIKAKFNGQAAGFYSPPFAKQFSEEEMAKQLKMIESSDADFIWVGLGAPKQEQYVVEMAQRSKKGAWLAVGAAFDFYAGLKPRAPLWMQTYGLEWLFRMASEPKRLVKRYFSTNPVFIYLSILEIFGQRKLKV